MAKQAKQTAAGKVWLTFDDGPHRAFTDRILTTLDNAGIGAVFFLVGKNVKRHGTLPREIVAAGHRVGNHTYTHPRLTELALPEVERELDRTEALIAELMGADKLFRPPFGARNAAVSRIVRKRGYRTLLWDVSTHDWNKDSQPTAWQAAGLKGVVRRKEKGSVVLMHDIQRTTAKHLGAFIASLNELGWVRFGAPAEL
ncbi:polysaccharide deacetylase family protein [soil metagenome]